MHKLSCLFIFFIFISLFSCHPVSSPSGKVRRNYQEDRSSSFSSKPSKRSKKPPQMGFYYKKPRKNIFSSVKFKISHFFASDDKKHKLKNDRRSTSQSYANKRQKRHQKAMYKKFIKGKKSKHRRKKTKTYDNKSNSFSSPKNKKDKKDK